MEYDIQKSLSSFPAGFFQKKIVIGQLPHSISLMSDAIAYDIVLKMIEDGKSQNRNDRVLEEYTYLTPMIFVDYIDLVYYTDRVLYKSYRHRKPPHFEKMEGQAFYNSI